VLQSSDNQIICENNCVLKSEFEYTPKHLFAILNSEQVYLQCTDNNDTVKIGDICENDCLLSPMASPDLVTYRGFSEITYIISPNICNCTTEGLCFSDTISYCPSSQYDFLNITVNGTYNVGYIYNQGPSDLYCGNITVCAECYYSFVNTFSYYCTTNGTSLLSVFQKYYSTGGVEYFSVSNCKGALYSIEDDNTFRFGNLFQGRYLDYHQGSVNITGYMDTVRMTSCDYFVGIDRCEDTVCYVNVSSNCVDFLHASGYRHECQGEGNCVLKASRMNSPYSDNIGISSLGKYVNVFGPEIPPLGSLVSKSCVPFCGIPYLQDLKYSLRIFILICMVIISCIIVGYISVKLEALKDYASVPLRGWRRIFGIIWYSICMIAYGFLYMIRCCLCLERKPGKKTKVVRLQPEDDIEMQNNSSSEEEVVTKGDNNTWMVRKQKKKVKVTYALLLLCLPVFATQFKSAKAADYYDQIIDRVAVASPLTNVDNGVNFNYSSIVPCSTGSIIYNRTNYILDFRMSSKRGNEFCVDINTINFQGKENRLNNTVRFSLKSNGVHTILGTKTFPQIGYPNIQIMSTCECPGPQTHYCDMDHKSSNCISSQCSFRSATGSKSGCGLTIGNGHYCMAGSLGNSQIICNQFPVRQLKSHLDVSFFYNSNEIRKEISFSDLDYFLYDEGIYFVINTINEPSEFLSYARGLILNCGFGNIWLDRSQVLNGVYGSVNDPGFFQFDNTSWNTNLDLLLSQTSFYTDQCTTSYYTAKVFDFNAAYNNPTTNAQMHFVSYGDVISEGDNMLLEWSKEITIGGSLVLNKDAFIGSIPEIKCSMVNGSVVGRKDDQSSGLNLHITCNNLGQFQIYVNDVSVLYTAIDMDDYYFYPILFDALIENLNITVCSVFDTECTTSTQKFTIADQDKTSFTKTVVSDVFSPGNVGAGLLGSNWVGNEIKGKSIPLWQNILIGIAIFIMIFVIIFIVKMIISKVKSE